MNRDSDAIDVYTSLLEHNPDNVAALNNLAWLLRDSDEKRALEYAEKAHSLAPGAHAVTDTLAVLVSESDNKRAQKLIREALEANPDDPTYRFHQALILERANQPEEAVQVLQDLLQDSPDSPSADEAKDLLKALEG